MNKLKFKERGENRRKTSQPLTDKGLFKRPFGDQILVTKNRRKETTRRNKHIVLDNYGNELIS